MSRYLNQIKSDSIRTAAEYAAGEGPRIEQDKAGSGKPSIPGQSKSNVERETSKKPETISNKTFLSLKAGELQQAIVNYSRAVVLARFVMSILRLLG